MSAKEIIRKDIEIKIKLPQSKRGRKSKQQKLEYQNDLRLFAEAVKQVSDKYLKIDNKPFKISSRGWSYQLEGFNLIDKSQFDFVQKLINDCRKEGLLPLDFVAEDKAREFYHVENLQGKYKDPKKFLIGYLDFVKKCPKFKKEEVAFWESQEYYLQMMVEKIDVLTLFSGVCEKFHVPLCNAKGWSDINSRGKLSLRFKEAEEIGLKPVLLYYGDFDPAGLFIGKKIKKNLKDLEKATEWNPENLIIDRFGLTYDFIQEYNLTWIDNLITGSKKNLADPRHRDHNKPYVQDYIQKYGIRKVEANAILIIPNIAIEQCREAIFKYIDEKAMTENYNKLVSERMGEVFEIMNNVNIFDSINEIIESIENLENKNHD